MTQKKPSRPTFVTDEHLEFLDDLRESGITNMFGAPQYLMEEFGLARLDARAVFRYWADTFGNPNR